MKIYQKQFIYFKILLFLQINFIKCTNQCYSCAGTCHNEPCNCQIGSCEADYCFIERKPAEIPGAFRITKGCLKRPSRTQYGCDYDHFGDHIQCVCRGKFCNDAIYFRPTFRRNLTCRSCGERNPDCDDTCQGQWCHEDTVSGQTGCGFGPPSMPFFYKGPELLFNRNKLCITLSRGNNAKPRKYCICNTHLCNDFLAGSRYFGEAGLRMNQETNGPRSRSLITYKYVIF
uniref:Uncharacterized protein n=1 Tax=Panagrolaimus sp. PS1159 TaxID=55785 RepID=A0AC35GB84_9BILA